MKNKMLVPIILMSVSMVGGMLSGCSTASSSDTGSDTEQTAAAAEEDAATAAQADDTEDTDETAEAAQTDSAVDFLQERTQQKEFNSYDEIIEQLQPGEAYAYINVNGVDGEILAITDFIYTWSDSSYVSTRASLYAEGQDGKVSALAFPETGDTGTPLYCADGVLYVCNLYQYAEMQFDDDGILYFTKQVVRENASDGTDTFSGYIMTDRSTSKELNITSDEEFSALFDGLQDLSPISFTRVEYTSYDDVIDNLQDDELYAFFGIDGYDGEILAVSNSTRTEEFDGLTGTVATEAELYAERDGKAEYVGMVTTGDDYPIRNSDGVLYICNPSQYSEMKIQLNECGRYSLYNVRYAGITYDEKGNSSYESYDLENETDSSVLKVTDDASFQALFTPLENIPPVSFWTKDSGFGR